jgi:sigma-B regulation protein RsbU (phosphoserine phosphatase)
MLVASPPPDEQERLEALYALRLLDTPQEDRFDAVTQLAAKVFDVPIAFVSLIDRDRQWFKSKVGFDLCESSREYSFCAHAILQDQPLVIPDTLDDVRFAGNPFVTAPPALRFYAGQPLRAAGGQKVGTLCLADVAPREFAPEQRALLGQLGAMVERELRTSDLIDAQSELLLVQRELLSTQRRLQAELRAAAEYVASQLPEPIEEPLSLAWKFVPSADVGGDGLGYHALDERRWAIYLLDVCGHGVAPALMAISLLGVLRSAGGHGADAGDPASVLAALNRDFPMHRHGNRFFTIWYGVIDVETGELVYASAGHPPAVVGQAGGRVTRLEKGGVPIGCVAAAHYENASARLAEGEFLYVFSDGAFELTPGQSSLEDFESRLSRVRNPLGALEAILAELRSVIGGGSFPDDVTILRAGLRGGMPQDSSTASSRDSHAG